MVDEININIRNLKNEIENLKNLKSNWGNLRVNSPLIQGSGKSISQISELISCYESMYTELNNLLTNTILFMENVSKTFKNADNSAAKSIQYN